MLNLILVRIYRILVETVNGMSTTKHVEHAFIRTAGWEIADLKFIDDEELVVAMTDQSKKRYWGFLCTPYANIRPKISHGC